MTKVAIIIPTHINYEGQTNLLDKCIQSLLNQTILPDSIYISLSFEDKYINDIKNIWAKYKKISRIIFKRSKKQKYQMEHLYSIVSNINEGDYDMFMFCDDDDTYHSTRVEELSKAFNYGKKIYPKKFGGAKEIFKDADTSSSPEYWAYGIKPSVIKDFFKLFENQTHKLAHKFGDLYLKHYLRRTLHYEYWMIIKPSTALYNYNKNNPNSICGKIERGIGCIDDNIFESTVKCRNNNDLNKVKKTYKKYKMKKYINDTYNFCQLLYK